MYGIRHFFACIEELIVPMCVQRLSLDLTLSSGLLLSLSHGIYTVVPFNGKLLQNLVHGKCALTQCIYVHEPKIHLKGLYSVVAIITDMYKPIGTKSNTTWRTQLSLPTTKLPK